MSHWSSPPHECYDSSLGHQYNSSSEYQLVYLNFPEYGQPSLNPPSDNEDLPTYDVFGGHIFPSGVNAPHYGYEINSQEPQSDDEVDEPARHSTWY